MCWQQLIYRSFLAPAPPGGEEPLLAPRSDSQHKAERVPTEELHEVRGAEADKGKDTCLGHNKGNSERVSVE